MKTFHGIGIMSGTSLDGIDIAFSKYSLSPENQWSFELIVAETIPYEAIWQRRLRYLPEQNAETFAKTNVYYAHLLGKTIQNFIQKHQIQPNFVASHGHTIFHQPQKNFTCQIGDGETFATYLKVPLVTNFRNKDIAFGGQGAPLVPFGEKFLFSEYELFLNLGGISNLTFRELAFDVSPCNFALNLLAKHHNSALEFDKNGQIAAEGNLDKNLLNELENLDYYKISGAKSLGAEWIFEEFIPILEKNNSKTSDKLNTVCVHIASQIAKHLKKINCNNTKMLMSGGGTHNQFLIGQIRKKLKPLNIELDIKQNSNVIDFKEAIIFGFLGLMTLLGKPNTLKSATGAQIDSISGSIHLPNNPNFKIFDL